MKIRIAPALGLLAGALIALPALAAETADTAPAPSAAAEPGFHGHFGAYRQMLGGYRGVLKQLNLSTDQQTQIKSVFANARPQLRSQFATARANREKLASLAPTDAGYPAALAAVQHDAAARVQLASDIKTQVYAVLTPEQQAKIPAIRAANKAAFAARRAAWQQAHARAAEPATTE